MFMSIIVSFLWTSIWIAIARRETREREENAASRSTNHIWSSSLSTEGSLKEIEKISTSNALVTHWERFSKIFVYLGDKIFIRRKWTESQRNLPMDRVHDHHDENDKTKESYNVDSFIHCCYLSSSFLRLVNHPRRSARRPIGSLVFRRDHGRWGVYLSSKVVSLPLGLRKFLPIRSFHRSSLLETFHGDAVQTRCLILFLEGKSKDPLITSLDSYTSPFFPFRPGKGERENRCWRKKKTWGEKIDKRRK